MLALKMPYLHINSSKQSNLKWFSNATFSEKMLTPSEIITETSKHDNIFYHGIAQCSVSKCELSFLFLI